jgi:hypothetical protein
MLLKILDVALFVLHGVWTLLVCVGWMWRRTRPWHQAAVALTAGSWFILGWFYGWGYCLFTDWHWQVRDQLGHPRDHSYTQLLIRTVTGVELGERASNLLTVGIFAAVVLLSVGLQVRCWLRRRRAAQPE